MASGYTITYTGAAPTTITYSAYEPSGGSNPDCLVTLNLNLGDTYYISANSLLSSYVDLEIVSGPFDPDKYFNFSGVCNGDKFSFRGRPILTPLTSGLTYCFSAYSCTSGITFNGCYKLVNIGSNDLGFTKTSWISEPIFNGFSIPECLATCSCSPPYPCEDKYCISNSQTDYDGVYTYAGTYGGHNYWTGDGLTTYYIYNNGNGWCLSESLGGTCLLNGKYPCISECPDLCDSFFSTYPCPATTTTTTSPCNVFDFDALFDCNLEPTPSPTPTPTVTPTVTVTPTTSSFCSVVGVDAEINSYSPTPTPTPTLTPTSTPEITRPCNFSGDVSFVTIDGDITCPRSFQFQDCLNGMMYYTTNSVTNPSGGEISQFMVFQSLVDGISRCISYVGINTDIIGVNNIELVEGPLGFSNLGDCIKCIPQESPTPTPTMTPSVTPTMTPTPSSSLPVQYYIYKNCKEKLLEGQQTFYYDYLVQTNPGPSLIVGGVFSYVDNIDKGYCWEFIGTSSTIPVYPPPNTVTTYSGNLFVLPSTPQINCKECLAII